MADHPLDAVLVNGQDVNKGSLKTELKKFVRDFGAVADFRLFSLPGVEAAIIANYLYYYDSADLVTADDGLACVHDADGRRFKISIHYEQGSFTPTLTFATPGNLSVAYTANAGTYTRIGNRIIWSLRLLTSSFTHTTASGALRVAGFPVAATSGQRGAASLVLAGYTKANYSQAAFEIQNAQTYGQILAGGSAQSLAALASGDVPSGGTVDLYASGQYQV